MHPPILMATKHLFKLQKQRSGCQGLGTSLCHRAAVGNTLALGKLQPVGHNHGSCAEKVGIVRGLILSGSNFQSEVVSSCVMIFLHKNLSQAPTSSIEGE